MVPSLWAHKVILPYLREGKSSGVVVLEDQGQGPLQKPHLTMITFWKVLSPNASSLSPLFSEEHCPWSSLLIPDPSTTCLPASAVCSQPAHTPYRFLRTAHSFQTYSALSLPEVSAPASSGLTTYPGESSGPSPLLTNPMVLLELHMAPSLCGALTDHSSWECSLP